MDSWAFPSQILMMYFTMLYVVFFRSKLNTQEYLACLPIDTLTTSSMFVINMRPYGQQVWYLQTT